MRSDLPRQPQIEAHFSKIVNTRLATVIGEGQAQVSTIEHLMAALHICGVDNALIEVSGPEVPILDGSADPFVKMISEAGVVAQKAKRSIITLKERVEVRSGEKWAVAEPCAQFEIVGTIEWDHPSIGFQEFKYLDGETDGSEFANARTFGFLQDVEALQRMGLCRGGSLDNAVVLDQDRVLNPEGLRYANEFARHKVLDALGDLKLMGAHLNARIRLHRAGHDLHQLLMKEIARHCVSKDRDLSLPAAVMSRLVASF